MVCVINAPAAPATAADTVIDGRGFIVFPGLINAHMHTWQTALRGMAKDPAQPPLSVKAIGDKLTGDLVLPLQVVALLLTAALVGGVVIAMSEKETE